MIYPEPSFKWWWTFFLWDRKTELLRKRGDAADLVERAASQPLNCSSPGAVIETICHFLHRQFHRYLNLSQSTNRMDVFLVRGERCDIVLYSTEDHRGLQFLTSRTHLKKQTCTSSTNLLIHLMLEYCNIVLQNLKSPESSHVSSLMRFLCQS